MNYADRVKETTTTTGPDTIVLAGAAAGYRAFFGAHAVGDKIGYAIASSTSGEFEVGIGTLVDATHLSRDTVYASSNGGGIVSFGSGTKDVFETVPGEQLSKMAAPDAAAVTTVANVATSTLLIEEGGTFKRIKIADLLASIGSSQAQLSAAAALSDNDIISITQDNTNEVRTTLGTLKTYMGGTSSPADSTAPSTPGSLSSSNVGQAAATLTWSASTDNVGVTAYEVTKDGTTWTNAGNVTSYTFTGLTASTTYTLQVRALDAAGNRSAASSLQVTTSAATDSTAPTMAGSITTSAVTSSGFTMTYSAGSDNVGVSRYEVSVDGGTTWIVNGTNLSYAATGKAASTTYQLRVRCFDAAGNVSNVLSGTVTTSAGASETLTVNTPAAQYTGTAFTVSGTYANGTPTALDYSLDGGTTWVAASSPTISGGNYSFSVTISTANASQTVKVRDHNVTSASATSGTFSVTAATAYTITAYTSGNAPKSGAGQAIDVTGQSLTNGKKYIGANTLMVSGNGYWNISPTPASAEWGWSNSPTTPPTNSITAAQNNGSTDSQNGMTPMSHPGAWSADTLLWITPGSGTTNWYAWCKPAGGVAQCMNPKDGNGNPIATVVTGG